ncbi:hypothetical protein BIV25_21630 [Streptomyces sp. MUSC 14]|nr:hypothetical protein BIV25_21630 [Streptomyces sp. MUSC 14]
MPYLALQVIGMGMGSQSGARPDVGLDTVLRTARAEGLSDPVEIVPPADSSSAYVVRQLQHSRPEKQDSIAVDPATGKVTDVSRFSDYPLSAKLTRWGIDAHTGTLFGLTNQIAPAGLALALILLILWGYRMRWQRGRGSALGYCPPPARHPLTAFLAVDILVGAAREHYAGIDVAQLTQKPSVPDVRAAAPAERNNPLIPVCS